MTIVKKFSQQDLDSFSNITGDFNPIHSTETPIEERRVHGAFLNAIVAGIIGTHIPGSGSIVLEQNFKFPNACRIEKDTFIKINLLNERKISVVSYECKQDDCIVFEGSAKLLKKISTK